MPRQRMLGSEEVRRNNLGSLSSRSMPAESFSPAKIAEGFSGTVKEQCGFGFIRTSDLHQGLVVMREPGCWLRS